MEVGCAGLAFPPDVLAGAAPPPSLELNTVSSYWVPRYRGRHESYTHLSVLDGLVIVNGGGKGGVFQCVEPSFQA